MFRLDGEDSLDYLSVIVSGPESESESEPESESIRSPESESEPEQRHHDSAPLTQTKSQMDGLYLK